MQRFFKKFLKNRSGNVAITFGFAAVPLVAVMGIAVDYIQASQLQAKFLMAADNGGLAAAQSDAVSDEELKKIVLQYLKKNGVMKGNFSKPVVKVTELDNGNLRVKLTSKMNTNMMRIVGRDTVDVSATSIISREFGDMDVALVLDNTGSMDGRKLATLKDASKNLVQTLHAAKDPTSEIRIGLVPFSDYVNIGMNNRHKSWANIEPDRTNRVRKSRWKREVLRKYNCRWKTRYYYRDGVRKSYTYQSCKYKYGRKYKEYYWHTTKVRWRGCVGSRNYPWNTRDERPSYRIPGIMNRSCSQPLTELTDSKNEVISNINSMRASGSTYIPAGLMWGWRVVSDAEPFANNGGSGSSSGSQKKRQRAIVLMTDGENTVSPTYPEHYGNNKTVADRLTSEICENIKNSDEEITVYTVAFEVSDNSTRNMLRACATSPSHYFNADNSAELAKSFQKIAKSLAQLRIAE